MTELKTCWTCKYRERDVTIKPCSECDDFFHDFHEYTNWEPQEK